MPKKTLASASAIALLLGLAACDDLESMTGDDDSSEEQADGPVTIPDVVGMSLSDAREELEELELDLDEYDAVEERSIWSAGNWEVVEQDPEAGSEVEPESSLSLGVRHESDDDEDTPEDDDQAQEGGEQSQEAEEENNLGQNMEEAALNEVQADSFSELAAREGWTNPVYAITEIEDMGASTVRVYLQENLSDTDRADVARWLFNMTCMEVPEVETIVVQDSTGLDSNHYAREFPRPNSCEE